MASGTAIPLGTGSGGGELANTAKSNGFNRLPKPPGASSSSLSSSSSLKSGGQASGLANSAKSLGKRKASSAPFVIDAKKAALLAKLRKKK